MMYMCLFTIFTTRIALCICMDIHMNAPKAISISISIGISIGSPFPIGNIPQSSPSRIRAVSIFQRSLCIHIGKGRFGIAIGIDIDIAIGIDFGIAIGIDFGIAIAIMGSEGTAACTRL